MLRFDPRPLPWVLLLLGVEIFIALEVRDALVRPYGGDVLAVVLVYAALRVVLGLDARALAATSFAVGAAVEIAQWLRLGARLGLSASPVISTILGSVFEWTDLGAYAVGALLAWLVDTRTALLSNPALR